MFGRSSDPVRNEKGTSEYINTVKNVMLNVFLCIGMALLVIMGTIALVQVAICFAWPTS